MRLTAFAFLLVLPGAAAAAPPLLLEARYPGASAEEVAAGVAGPLEVNLGGIPGVRRIRSLSREGRCLVRLELERDADPKQVRAATQKRLAMAKSALPKACAALGVTLLPDVDETLAIVALRPTQPAGLGALNRAARDVIRPALLRQKGVARVTVVGPEERVRIVLDPARLAARALTPEDVRSRLQNAAASEGPRKVQDLSGLVVAEQGGRKTFLRDVAAVELQANPGGGAGVALRQDKAGKGTAAVLLIVQPTPGSAGALPRTLEKALANFVRPLEPARIEWRLFRPGDLTAVVRLPERLGQDKPAALARAAAAAALLVPQIQAVYWLPGAAESELTLYLATGAGREDPRAGLRAALAKIDGATARVGALRPPWDTWPGEGMQVVARVHGTDPAEVRTAAGRLRERLGKVKGVVDLEQGPSERPRLEVQVDKDKCRELGLQVADVAQVINFGFGGVEVGEFKHLGKPALLTVAGGPGMRADDLLALHIRAGNQMVPVRALATVRRVDAPEAVCREDGRFCLVVAGNVEGRDVGEVRAEARRIVRDLALKATRVEIE